MREWTECELGWRQGLQRGKKKAAVHKTEGIRQNTAPGPFIKNTANIDGFRTIKVSCQRRALCLTLLSERTWWFLMINGFWKCKEGPGVAFNTCKNIYDTARRDPLGDRHSLSIHSHWYKTRISKETRGNLACGRLVSALFTTIKTISLAVVLLLIGFCFYSLWLHIHTANIYWVSNICQSLCWGFSFERHLSPEEISKRIGRKWSHVTVLKQILHQYLPT